MEAKMALSGERIPDPIVILLHLMLEKTISVEDIEKLDCLPRWAKVTMTAAGIFCVPLTTSSISLY
jgi:hypothetical protein